MTAQGRKELRLPKISRKDNLAVSGNNVVDGQKIIVGIVVEDMKQHDGRLHTMVDQPLTHRLGVGDDEVGRVEDANILTGIPVIAQRLDIVDDENNAVAKEMKQTRHNGEAVAGRRGILIIKLVVSSPPGQHLHVEPQSLQVRKQW